jgi:hypothetical protein
MNDELVIMRQETVVTDFMLRAEGRTKTTELVSLDSGSPCGILNLGSPEYEAGMMSTAPQLSVTG